MLSERDGEPMEGATQADRIRYFVRDRFIEPERAAGQAEVTIVAGRVADDMNLHGSMPAICSALGGNKILKVAHVDRLGRTGPHSGRTATFTFKLLPR